MPQKRVTEGVVYIPLDLLVNHSTLSGSAAIQSGSLIRGASKNVSTPIDPGSLPLVNHSAPSAPIGDSERGTVRIY